MKFEAFKQNIFCMRFTRHLNLAHSLTNIHPVVELWWSYGGPSPLKTLVALQISMTFEGSWGPPGSIQTIIYYTNIWKWHIPSTWRYWLLWLMNHTWSTSCSALLVIMLPWHFFIKQILMLNMLHSAIWKCCLVWMHVAWCECMLYGVNACYMVWMHVVWCECMLHGVNACCICMVWMHVASAWCECSLCHDCNCVFNKLDQYCWK